MQTASSITQTTFGIKTILDDYVHPYVKVSSHISNNFFYFAAFFNCSAALDIANTTI